MAGHLPGYTAPTDLCAQATDADSNVDDIALTWAAYTSFPTGFTVIGDLPGTSARKCGRFVFARPPISHYCAMALAARTAALFSRSARNSESAFQVGHAPESAIPRIRWYIVVMSATGPRMSQASENSSPGWW